MTIEIARRLGAALGVRSESKYRVINQAILEYVRLTQQSAVTPTSGPVSPDPKLFVVTTVIATSKTMADEDAFLVDDDTAGGVVTITLPAAATAKKYPRYIKKLGTTANVIIDANAAETIDGALTATLTTQYEALMLLTDGSNWHIL